MSKKLIEFETGPKGEHWIKFRGKYVTNEDVFYLWGCLIIILLLLALVMRG